MNIAPITTTSYFIFRDKAAQNDVVHMFNEAMLFAFELHIFNRNDLSLRGIKIQMARIVLEVAKNVKEEKHFMAKWRRVLTALKPGGSGTPVFPKFDRNFLIENPLTWSKN